MEEKLWKKSITIKLCQKYEILFITTENRQMESNSGMIWIIDSKATLHNNNKISFRNFKETSRFVEMTDNEKAEIKEIETIEIWVKTIGREIKWYY
jgi:hypothetical protein